MGRILMIEVRRALRSRSMFVALALGLALCLFGIFADYGIGFIEWGEACNAWSSALHLLMLLAPLLATLPFGDSYLLDRNTGFARLTLARTSGRAYFLAKMIANAFAGGLVIALPILGAFLLASVIFPVCHLPEMIQAQQQASLLTGQTSAFQELWLEQPALYALVITCLGFLFGVTCATLALALSTIVQNRYLLLAAPLLFYWVVNFILAYLHLERWSLYTTVIPHTIQTTTPVTIFVPLAVIFLVSISALIAHLLNRRVIY